MELVHRAERQRLVPIRQRRDAVGMGLSRGHQGVAVGLGDVMGVHVDLVARHCQSFLAARRAAGHLIAISPICHVSFSADIVEASDGAPRSQEPNRRNRRHRKNSCRERR